VQTLLQVEIYKYSSQKNSKKTPWQSIKMRTLATKVFTHCKKRQKMM